MEKLDGLPLEVGQLAEMKSFDHGFRGAWFRCKIRDVFMEKEKVRLEYYDFPDEEISLAKLYEVPHYGRKSKQIKKQLMMRPHYPLMYNKSEMPPINSISEVCVIIDGTWKVGDLVDWFKDDCYWSARVIEVLSDDKVQIELPMAPAGEGGTHEAFCKDLRPALDWSAGKGWTLATMDGESSSSAQLIFPSQQQDEVQISPSQQQDVQISPSQQQDEIQISPPSQQQDEIQISPSQQQDEVQGMESEVENAVAGGEGSSSISAAMGMGMGMEGDRMISEQVKMDGKGGGASTVSSSEDSISISTLHVEEGKEEEDDVIINLNMMHEDTLEAAVVDLEELVNRIKWVKSILETNQDTSPSSSSSHWKFAAHQSP